MRKEFIGHPVGNSHDENNPLGFMYVGGIKRPHCQVGDTLWVRETWQYFCRNKKYASTNSILSHSDYCFKASNDDAIYGCCEESGCKWRPSIHMPREAARIFLNVTDVKVQRIQNITEEEVKAEGISLKSAIEHNKYIPGFDDKKLKDTPSYTNAFAALWNSLYENKSYGWNVNPFVWVIEFERIVK